MPSPPGKNKLSTLAVFSRADNTTLLSYCCSLSLLSSGVGPESKQERYAYAEQMCGRFSVYVHVSRNVASILLLVNL